MSWRRLGIALGMVAGLGVIAVVALLLLPSPPEIKGKADGVFKMSGGSGTFQLEPDYCRKAKTEIGVGVYATRAPTLAVGVFKDLDGGKWVEVQAPGMVGVSTFPSELCTVLDFTLVDAGSTVSGRVQLVCDNHSPGASHVEGEAAFEGCR